MFFLFAFSRHNYLTFASSAIPPPPTPPLPGPGTYEVRDFKDVEKKYMSSAAFVSNSGRWSFGAPANADQPGPASYTPRQQTKQSFNFNLERKWLT